MAPEAHTTLDVRMPAPPGRLAPGDVIDGFRLGAHLHQGGMAQIWAASRVDGTDELPLIMKIPRIKGGREPASIVGFEVEQMILPLLSGPHVPRYVARGDFTRQPFIVTERIPGETLKPRFDAAPLPWAEVAEIGAKVAVALHDLHRQHVVHLDVKPSNVMFRPSGEAVLVDFGLSRHQQLPDLLEEEFELPIGTGPYMSPEQVQFVRDDPRSDIFALGVLMYHLLTGVRPFGAPDTVRGLRKRLYQDPEPPRVIRADCPAWLQEIVLRCLEVDPEQRYQSAAQLAFDLQNAEQVVITARGERSARSGPLATLRRWFAAIGADPRRDRKREPGCAIVMAALDVGSARPALLDAIRDTVQRTLQLQPDARLACVAVMRTNRIADDKLLDDEGRSIHVNLLVQLRHWARPVEQALAARGAGGDARVTFHVLESPDAATALVDYARRNQIDHIVMGARSSSALRRYLGSVSARVVAEAHCTTTVVRAR